jgi:hypothetical protein
MSPSGRTLLACLWVGPSPALSERDVVIVAPSTMAPLVLIVTA